KDNVCRLLQVVHTACLDLGWANLRPAEPVCNCRGLGEWRSEQSKSYRGRGKRFEHTACSAAANARLARAAAPKNAERGSHWGQDWGWGAIYRATASRQSER